MDTDTETSIARIACHHPGGKNNTSPGSRVTLIALGTTFCQKAGESRSNSVANTSIRDVLVIDGSLHSGPTSDIDTLFVGEEDISFEHSGDASQTDFLPTTWTVSRECDIDQ